MPNANPIRYTMSGTYWPEAILRTDPEGEYVSFIDYVALKAEYETLWGLIKGLLDVKEPNAQR